MHGRSGRNEREAAPAELAGIADDDRGLRIFHHHAVGARFEKVGSREAVINVESIDREEQKIGGDVPQRIFGERADQRKRIPSQHAAR